MDRSIISNETLCHQIRLMKCIDKAVKYLYVYDSFERPILISPAQILAKTHFFRAEILLFQWLSCLNLNSILILCLLINHSPVNRIPFSSRK